jgi:hypothetical protein
MTIIVHSVTHFHIYSFYCSIYQEWYASRKCRIQAEKSSHPSTSTLANNVDPVEQKTSSQIEGHRHLKESNPLRVSLEYERICSCLHCTQFKSSNDKSSSSSNEKGQILTTTYASKESQFISLGSISGRAEIELLHENENAQYVSQVQASTTGRSTQTNKTKKLHDDFLSLDIFVDTDSPIPMPKLYKFIVRNGWMLSRYHLSALLLPKAHRRHCKFA